MKRFCIRLLSCLIVDRRKRKLFRLRHLHRYEEPEVHGTDNEIVNCPPTVKVMIFGDGNRVEFREPLGSFRGLFMIGTPDSRVSHATVTIGEKTSAEHVTVWVLEDDSVVSIGRDCMVSKDVQIWSTDAHALFDDGGRLLNGGAHSVTVGNHCWLGYRSCLLKGAVLPDDVIVGMNSVVTGGKELASNCAYAGSPARLVREHVHWDRSTPQNFVHERNSSTI